METLTLGQWVGLLAIMSIVIIACYQQYRELEDRELAKRKIKELQKFYNLVSDCDITGDCKAYIEQRLKRVRAEALMENKDFCNLVDEITTCYYSRFGLYGYTFETGM